MKASTGKKPTTHVWLALANGAFFGNQTSHQVVLFLASSRGQWAVYGPDHTQKWWAFRLGVHEATLKRALADLRKRNVIEVDRRKYRTTYYLTERFLDHCQSVVEQASLLAKAAALYEQYPDASRGDLARMYRELSEQEQEELSQPQRRNLAPHGGATLSPVGAQPCAFLCREDQETGFRRPPEGGRPDGRPETPTQEGTQMTDFPTEGWDPPKKRASKWGAKSEGTPLGGEQSVGVAKATKSSPPRYREVLVIIEYFQSKLLAFSEARHVPLWEIAGKVNRNVDYLLKQGHSQDTLERAIDFFASQAPSMMFQGTSLWDQFFAHREDALKFAVVAGYGTRGGSREDVDDLAKRLSRHQQQTRSK